MYRGWRCLLLSLTVCFFNEGGSITVAVEKTMSAQVGGNLIIPCKTDADLNSLTLQWYIMEEGNRIRVFYKKQSLLYPETSSYSKRVSIVNDTSLFVKNVSLVDEREFICSVTLSVNTEENSTQVKVYAIPSLKSSSNTDPLVVNNIFQKVADCVSEGGYPESKIVWYKDGHEIIKDVEITPEVTNNQGLFRVSSELKIQPQKSDKDSFFQCSVITLDGATQIKASSEMRVTVHYPPESASLEVDPPNFIKEGDQVTLTCVADAYPPPIYTFKGPTQVSKVGKDNVWKIENIYRHNGGVYKCEVHYTASPGKTTAKAERQLNVHYMEKPKILGVPNGNVNNGENFTMTCNAVASGNITYYWTKDGKSIEDGYILSRYQVSSIDSGSYTCVAQLDEGPMSVNKMVHITVPDSLLPWHIIALVVSISCLLLLTIGIICYIKRKRTYNVTSQNDAQPEEFPLQQCKANGRDVNEPVIDNENTPVMPDLIKNPQ